MTASVAVSPSQSPAESSFAASSLKSVTALWFAVLFAGQLIFALAVAAFYGINAARGNIHAWNRGTPNAYVAGDAAGNTMVVIHLASAVIVILGGIVQMIPAIRRNAPKVHRWVGRIYIASAFAVSLAGLEMMWVRGTVGTLEQHLGTSLMAILIMIFAILALRSARHRDFAAHSRWAMRLFLTVSASLFVRAAGTLGAVLLQGSAEFATGAIQGTFLDILAFAQYLLPLAVFELYWRVRSHARPAARLAMATLLLTLTLVTGAGIVTATAGIWQPKLKRAFDSRPSIAELLSVTIAARGIESAEEQYRQLRRSSPPRYNFDEGELNSLGYELLNAHKFPEAIRVFRLNTEAYPASANTWDSLAEGYVDAGDRSLAIVNYRKSLALNPANQGAVAVLKHLGAR
jgi:hypothetical protein